MENILVNETECSDDSCKILDRMCDLLQQYTLSESIDNGLYSDAATEILNDFHHLLQVHDNPEAFNQIHMTITTNCQHSAECEILRRNQRRRRRQRKMHFPNIWIS